MFFCNAPWPTTTFQLPVVVESNADVPIAILFWPVVLRLNDDCASNKPSKYVLEMNAGSVKNFNLKRGDKIYFIQYKWIIIILPVFFIIIIYFKYFK